MYNYYPTQKRTVFCMLNEMLAGKLGLYSARPVHTTEVSSL